VILEAVFLITGFHTLLIGLLADLIAVNRRLSEDMLIRLKRLEMPQREREVRPQQRQRLQRGEPRDVRPAAAAGAVTRPPAKPDTQKPDTQWVWLLDEEKLQDRGLEAPEEKPPAPAAEEAQPAQSPSRRRRRRRGGGGGGLRQHAELPGNRGKHLGESQE
jgi:hypothetical protein